MEAEPWEQERKANQEETEGRGWREAPEKPSPQQAVERAQGG